MATGPVPLDQGFTYQGRFLTPDGTQPMTDTVNITFSIYSGTGSCLLYQETDSGINLATTQGLFSIVVGSAVGDPKRVSGVDPGLTLAQIFSNNGQILPNGANCSGGYTPASGEGRKLHVVLQSVTDGTNETMSPDLALGPVPQATVAETLQGLNPTNFIQADSSITQATADALTNGSDASALHNHDSLYVKLGTGGSQNIGSGSFYTSGTFGVGTSAAPSGTEFQVDSSGAATKGVVIQGTTGQTANLFEVDNGSGSPLVVIDPSGNLALTSNATLGLGTFASSPSACTAGQIWYSGGQVQYCGPGNTVQTLGTAGSGIASLGGLTAATQSLTTGTTGLVPNWTTSGGNTQILNIPLASTTNVTAGLLSNADYGSFNGKVSGSANLTTAGALTQVTSAGTVTQSTGLTASTTANVNELIVQAGSNQNSTPLTQWANGGGTIYTVNPGGTAVNNSDLVSKNDMTSILSANLGSYLPLAGGTLTGPLTGSTSDNTAAALSAVNSSSAPLLYVRNDGNVGIGTTNPLHTLEVNGTVNATGLSIGGTAVTSSQWTTASPNISFTGGDVGIGTATPKNALDVSGGVALGSYAGVDAGPSNGLIVSGSVGVGTTSPSAGLDIATAGVASTPGALIEGAWFTTGTGATNTPQLLIQPSGTSSSSWSVHGTGLGVNAASGFAGNLIDLQVGGSSVFSVSATGVLSNSSVDWAAPSAIGTGTPAAGTFTSLAASGYSQSTGNFAMSGTGTFATGTGNVSLNGATTVSANQNFSLASGTGTITQTYTGTSTAATITANSLTSGNILSLSSTSTAAAANNTGLNISISGANGTSGITRYGQQTSVTSTGTTSTNVAGYFKASGASNNYGLLVASGSVGIGTTAPSGTLDVEGGTATTGSGTNITLTAQTGKQSGNTNGGNIILTPGAGHNSGTPGYVGVGTTAPAALLHVNGEAIVGNTGLACSATTVGALHYNTSTNIVEFCNGTSWTSIAAQCSQTVPTGLSFSNQANDTVSTLVQSNIVQVAGINCAVSVSISGAGSPQYQICADGACGTVVQGWTSGPSSVTNGQYIQVQTTTATNGGATSAVTLIAGGAATIWDVATTGSCAGLPSTPPPVGTVCADGTVYAGTSPDTSAPMFTTRCDLGQTWNGIACTGAQMFYTWNNGSSNWVDDGQENTITGKANTAYLAGRTSPSDIGAPYYAAADCNSLSTSGVTEGSGNWYLPSQTELAVLWDGEGAIGNFDMTGNWYWSSTECNIYTAWAQEFSSGEQNAYDKNATYLVRCVRR